MGNLWACPESRPSSGAMPDSPPPTTKKAGTGPYWAESAQFAAENWTLFIAHAMEGAEFAIYASLEPWISPAFFGESRVFGWLTFGVGFACQPFGGVLFGLVADHYGRQPAVLGSLYLMCFATLGQGLTPPVPKLGPIWLIVSRALQGVALGGAESSSAVYLAENAPKRLLAVSGLLVFSGSQIGFILVTAGALGLSQALTLDQMLLWGWRVPFFVCVVPSFAALYGAHFMEETEEFDEYRQQHGEEMQPYMELCRTAIMEHYRNGLLVVAGTASVYAQAYLLGAYFKDWLVAWAGRSQSSAFLLLLASQTGVLLAAVPYTYFGDHGGLGKLMVASGAAASVLSLPLYAVLSTHPASPMSTVVAIVLPAFIDGAAVGMFPWTVDMFPVEVRGTAVSLYMNIAVSLGSFGPAICESIPSPLTVGVYSVLLGLLQVAAVGICLRLHRRKQQTGEEHHLCYLRDDPY
eukprot:EG_transcript_9880